MKTLRIVQLKENELNSFYPYFRKNIYNQFTEFTSKTRTFFVEEYPLEKLRLLIKEKNKFIFVALECDTIIGFLMANKVHGGISFCEWLIVDKDYQKQGIGTALLRQYEVLVQNKGAHKVHLWCADRNVAFYEKVGYILAGRIPEDYFGVDNNLMYKKLQEPKEENYLQN